MDYFHRFLKRARQRLFLLVLVNNAVLIAAWWVSSQYTPLSNYGLLGALITLAIILSIAMTITISNSLTQPLKAVWQAVVHLAPGEQNTPPPPVIDSLKTGRELVANLTAQIYQLASVAAHNDNAVSSQPAGIKSNFIASNLPLPLIVIDKDRNIIFASDATKKYLAIESDDIISKNLYSVLDMSFNTSETFDVWLQDSIANAATATKSWERVRLNLADQKTTKLFDLAAYYNKDNPENIETMLVMFDHTEQYSQDDQAMGFVALAVHELRTPLTLLRGYIEVFEEEFAGKLNPELSDFMFKMNASVQQLAGFVNNILNLARIENDQMSLQLQEQNWKDIIKSATDNLALRAKVHGIAIEYTVAPDLPTVGADRVSIFEVLTNLLDNAIKYSGKGKKILVNSSLNQDGLVETSVQDFGVGIPPSVIENLFTKFYRNHRSRGQVSGTGLGLYLSKAIISAHGGNIWVRSKEDEGTTVSFTIQPYAKLAEERKNNDNKDIVRGAHGWIKNHSLYRR
jgi:signal transduction histidine kinase